MKHFLKGDIVKPRLCIVGGSQIVSIAKKVAAEFEDQADFLYIPRQLDGALLYLRRLEGDVDIALAGPSTRRMCSNELKIPVISFRPTFPDVIRAIQSAQRIHDRIAICLSRDDRDFDIALLSQVLEVSIHPFYCDTSEEYEKACAAAKKKDYRVVIGGSFTVHAARTMGLTGILLYKGRDMIRTAVKSAI
ncbi:MAG: hypothetical protein EHM36_09490 [Deltaproteobacteria bacterium]|nr:MAG: hypothetical protein EHM36_09490 [Deltaproteobacteria bacterium]